MGSYQRRIQAPEKTRTADWVPEEGELFKNGTNLYMGDNTTASNALTPINGGGGGAPVGLPYTFSTATSASGISNGQVRINNVTPGSATTMWIAQNDAEVQDRGTVLNTLSAGGVIYINTAGDDGSVGVFRVTAMVDSGTYYTLTVSNFSGALPNDGAAVRVTIAPVEVTGVRIWEGFISQSGTDAPTVTTLVNTLGGNPVMSYDTPGVYYATLAGAFGETRTTKFTGLPYRTANANEDTLLSVYSEANDILTFSNKSPVNGGLDDSLNAAYFIIKVYP